MRPKRRGIDMRTVGRLPKVVAWTACGTALFAAGATVSAVVTLTTADGSPALACTAEEMPRAYVLHGSKAVRAPDRDRTCRAGLAYVWRDDDGRVRWFSGDPDSRGPVWYADDAENDGSPPTWAEWEAQ